MIRSKPQIQAVNDSMHLFPRYIHHQHLVPGGPGLTRIVRSDESRLVLVVRFRLTERETSLAAHTLRRPDLLDSLLEPSREFLICTNQSCHSLFLSRPIV